ncbi:MAG: PAS domain S-box protein [Armatimonadota bacterium]
MQLSLTSILLANATALLILCGLYVHHVNPRSPLNRALCIFCLLLATGCLGEAIVFGTLSERICSLAYHVAWIGWAFYPAFAILVAILLTEHERWLKHWWGSAILFLPAVAFFVTSLFFPLGVEGFTRTVTGNFMPEYSYTPWDTAYTFYQYTFDLFALAMITWWGLVSGSNRKQYQALSVLMTAILALLLDMVSHYGGPHGELSALRGFEHVLFAGGLAFSVTYHRFVTPTVALATHYILQHINDLVILMNTDGVILDINPPVEQASGRPVAELIGQQVTTLFHPDDAPAVHHCLTHIATCPGIQEARLRQPDGTFFPVSLNCELLIDHYRDTIGAVLIGRDLRETKQLEQEIAARTASEDALRRSHEELESLVQQRTAELAKANADLVQEEELYRGIFESIQDIYFRMDLHGIILMVSPSIYPISGYTAEEIIGRTITDLGADLSRFRQNFLRQLKKHGHVEDYEVALYGKNGEQHITAINAHFVYDPHSAAPVAIEGTIHDVTARYAAEQALRESEEKFRQLYTQFPVGIVILDEEGFPIDANPATLRILGVHTVDDLKIFSMFDDPTLSAERKVQVQQGQTIRYELHYDFAEARRTIGLNTTHSHTCVLLVTIAPLHSGTTADRHQYLMLLRDITEQTLAEEALRASQTMLNRAQQIAGVGSWEVDSQTREFVWSDQMYRLYGLDPTSFTPSYAAIMAYILPEDREKVATKFADSIDHGVPYTSEHRIQTPDGAVRTLQGYGELLFDANGQPERFVGCTLDVTERKYAEATILQYQQALRSLALDLSLTQERERRRLAVDLHDQISQPLVLAHMQLQGLRKKSDDPEFATALGEVAGHLEQLIQLTSTLTFELSPPILYELGFDAAVEWLAEEMQQRHGLHITVEVTGTHPRLDNEPRIVLFRVIQELLMNVVKHAHATETTIHIDGNPEHIRVTVTDNGCGLDEGQSREPDTKGGFGLFSIHERLQYFNGHLDIVSEAGKGTRVTIDFPIPAQEKERVLA